MLRVGLTGGIACGKSLVLRRLAAASLPTLDLDQVAREVMAPGQPAYAKVVETFGPAIVGTGGQIDRPALAARVFADAAARERLNAIVHPLIRAEEALRARDLEEGGASALVTDAALLVESGLHLRFDRLVVVHCRPEQQIARLVARDGLSAAAAQARVAAQMPIEVKRRFGHFLIDTSGSLAETHRAAESLGDELHALSARPRAPVAVPRSRILGMLVHGPQRGPRGLKPAGLAVHLAESDGLDLVELARRLEPPASLPWYAAGEEAGAPGEPAALAGALALHEVLRRGHDPDRIAAAAHSLAWLTERAPERLAGAVLMAQVVGELAAGTDGLPGLEARLPGLRERARRWGGGEPDAAVTLAVRAVLRHPEDPAAASRAGEAAAGGAGLGEMLVGLVVGEPEPASPEMAPLLEALASVPSKA